ncbi:ORF6N domain-containing protein [Psychrobacillus sp. FSL K6-1267]|uniref:ORF6N domain-containing protein n=1 Tax=Psychrobacillus sp. FSL K6-1267 TaxID=2921543 RepID=UPI0030F66E49
MELQVIEREGRRVLTSAQISKSFEMDTKILLRNFQRNTDRYEEGKHYFALNGEALKEFKASRQHDATLKFASSLYLWTEQGVWLLAKSLNSDKAWKAYEMLVDNYYQIKKFLQLPEDIIRSQGEKIIDLEHKVEKYEKRLLTIEQNMMNQITLNSGEQRRLQKAVGERAFALEKNASKRGQVFRAIYSSIKKQFNVKSYRDVKQHELQKAIRFVEKWND